MIESLTVIVGDVKSGKSTLAKALCAHKHNMYLMDEGITLDHALRELHIIKTSATKWNLVLVGDMIYKLVDHDFGNILRFEIKCSKKEPIKWIDEDKESKPLFD